MALKTFRHIGAIHRGHPANPLSTGSGPNRTCWWSRGFIHFRTSKIEKNEKSLVSLALLEWGQYVVFLQSNQFFFIKAHISPSRNLISHKISYLLLDAQGEGSSSFGKCKTDRRGGVNEEEIILQDCPHD